MFAEALQGADGGLAGFVPQDTLLGIPRPPEFRQDRLTPGHKLSRINARAGGNGQRQ